MIQIYRKLLSWPKALLSFVGVLCLVSLWFTQDFSFDASADTLVVQGDPELATYREMTSVFTGDDFLIVTYGRDSLFSSEALTEVDALQQQLSQIDGIKSVFSLLDAPLLSSPPMPMAQISTGFKTLRTPGVDLALAKYELTHSPMFREFLVSADGTSTALRLDLSQDQELESLRMAREHLMDKLVLTEDEGVQLGEISTKYHNSRMAFIEHRESLITKIRKIRENYSGDARLFISGVPMIAADMISYVKSDLLVFGSLVLILIIALLYFFFRRLRWVCLPIMISSVTILVTTGTLGALKTPVTVVSSNFISLLAILCISFSIHLIVRYRELLVSSPDRDHFGLVLQTMTSKFTPCLYTAMTTLLAFGSMLGSRILPIEDFGWMMCLGIIVAFLATYGIFPALLILLGAGEPAPTISNRLQFTAMLSHFCRHHANRVLTAAMLITIIATIGVSQVSFNNRFIDYFDQDTDIHTGMVYIDKNLGGTIPLDIYIRFFPFEIEQGGDDDFFAAEAEIYPDRYWYTDDKIEIVARLHEYLEGKDQTGKVVSLATMEQVARGFNDGKQLTSLEIAYVLGQLPESIHQQLILGYSNPAAGLLRINARIRESGPLFPHHQLIREVRQFAEEELELSPERVVITGMMVLFNDMLIRLADSQARTLFYVILATFLMFTLLLRSPILALLALIPNVIAAATVVAFMGYSNIPLDMMTITIAAICIGIGVDDAIHYLHRFRIEFRRDQNTVAAVDRAHLTIGRAMYFTSMIVIGGFSVLAFSNFLPTVYFGLLTALAMGLALLANLTVLPCLLIRYYAPGTAADGANA